MPAEGAELKSSLSLAFGISPVVETFFEKKTNGTEQEDTGPDILNSLA